MMQTKTDQLWCAWCGVFGDHTSGSCEAFKREMRLDKCPKCRGFTDYYKPGSNTPIHCERCGGVGYLKET